MMGGLELGAVGQIEGTTAEADEFMRHVFWKESILKNKSFMKRRHSSITMMRLSQNDNWGEDVLLVIFV